MTADRSTACNMRLAKKRVQCLNEALCLVSSSVLADSLVLRNPLLSPSAKTFGAMLADLTTKLTEHNKV